MNRTPNGHSSLDAPELLHRCKGGCGEMIEPREFSCRECWLRLPRQLQIGVCSCWDHQMGLVIGMLERAVEHFEAHPPLPVQDISERAKTAKSL